MKRTLLIVPLILLALVSCRSETQNKLRRDVQDITGGTYFISLYALGGQEIFTGKVNGKVTRADGADGGQGNYVYWYDEKGRYHQTDMPYVVSSYDRKINP